jgi:hypothetical protein
VPLAVTLTEHWDGAAWSVVASPNGPNGDTLLTGAAASSGQVWSVGFTLDGTVYKTFVIRHAT